MTIKSRLARLEAEALPAAMLIWQRFIWARPKDDEALKAASAAAQAAGRGLMVVRCVAPSPLR